MRSRCGRWSAVREPCSALRSAGIIGRPSNWRNPPSCFQLAVSLGAVESLIEQPASMSHASYDKAHRLAHGIGDSLVRISVGLEAFEDLRDDLAAALEVAVGPR